MILLASDCLLFRLADGQSVPLRPEMLTIEVTQESGMIFDTEFINHVAAAVFHYFKFEKGRDSVTLAEFSETLEFVLRGFAQKQRETGLKKADLWNQGTDLAFLAGEAGGHELFFYPMLRTTLRSRLNDSPGLVRFRGLRGCVKKLCGAQRWSSRCQGLQEQIVSYLRGCFEAEPHSQVSSLLVE